MAIFWNVARSIVILLAFVLHEASYISCSCLRAWNISCSASVSVFVAGVSVGERWWCSGENFSFRHQCSLVGFWRLSMGQEDLER